MGSNCFLKASGDSCEPLLEAACANFSSFSRYFSPRIQNQWMRASERS
jgi:hypothetical protein